MPEETIIRECQAGNRSGFGKLYDLYAREIYDFVYYKTHHKETAEDIASETFFKALKNIHQFDASRSFRAWLFGIARNAVMDHYRRLRPTFDIDDIWDIAADDDVARDADTRLKVEKVSHYLAALPAIQRDILILRVWQDLSYKEIAEIIGKSEDNCKVIFSRTMKELRKKVPAAAFLLLLLLAH